MKKYVVALILLTCFLQSAFAQKPPLRVAIDSLSPPFVMQSDYDKYYGFDIATMEYICRTLERPCEYLRMNADNLIPALQTAQADIAIGGLVMTLQNARRVRFSTPYMISKAQFITNDQASFTDPFKINQLRDKRIGVLEGSAFEQIVASMRVNKTRIITFKRDSDIIAALRANTLDIALLSFLQANYWEMHSNNMLKPIGRAFPVGLGFSIAITPGNEALVREINAAIAEYQESTDYKRNYNLYFPEKF